MHLSILLDMAADGFGDRVGFGPRDRGLTYGSLHEDASRTAQWIARRPVERVGLVDTNSDVVPRLLFGASLAARPFAPINYRLADDRLRAILARTAPSVVVVSEEIPGRVGAVDGVELVPRDRYLDEIAVEVRGSSPPASSDVEDPAILLFTSGTTGDPKASVLRHRHLGSYVVSTVEFMGAAQDESALVSVPPYHIAGLSAVVTSVFAGRRVVYLPAFSADSWVETVRQESVTQAMVVPTMLDRILDILDDQDERLPDLRHIAYGGGKMPRVVIERALEQLSHVDFVNAYGLTETSSTISVLTPADHRSAVAAEDPVVRRRLASVGRPLPSVEVQIRDVDGVALPPNRPGEVWVRGEQVAGEYEGDSPSGRVDDWFATRDAGQLDEGGYLFLDGRLDDVIVRGAENLSPGEIEEVLLAHPAVVQAAVVGVPDVEWGEQVAAAVVVRPDSAVTEADLQRWVRERLRSSRTPVRIQFRAALPHNEMGKLLRRVLRDELAELVG